MSDTEATARPGRSEPVWSHRPGLELTAFPRGGPGEPGYRESAVDSFVQQAVQDQSGAEEQIRDLRAEVDRLHRYIRRQWTAVAAAESAGCQTNDEASLDSLISPAAQARAVLTQAQEIADRRLAQADARLSEAQRLASDRLVHADRQARLTLAEADREAARRIAEGDSAAGRRLAAVDGIAEQVLSEARRDAEARRVRAQVDSNRLLMLARTRYQDIVARAHQRADRAAELALDEYQEPRTTTTPDTGRTRVELEMKAAYLRTFAKVSRAALQAALDVTAREFDRLLGATVLHETPSSKPAAVEPPALVLVGPGRTGDAPGPGGAVTWADAKSDPAHAGETGSAATISTEVEPGPGSDALGLTEIAELEDEREAGSAATDSADTDSDVTDSDVTDSEPEVATPLIAAPRTEWRLIVLPETELATVTRLR